MNGWLSAWSTVNLVLGLINRHFERKSIKFLLKENSGNGIIQASVIIVFLYSAYSPVTPFKKGDSHTISLLDAQTKL